MAVVGDIADGFEPVYDEGVTAVFSINNLAIDFPRAKLRARQDLALTMDSILRFSRALGRVAPPTAEPG